jgi:hypothetical protein
VVATYLVLVIPTMSYARALLYPGQASIGVRTVDWVRDHGGAPLVDTLENWWYTRHPPPTKAPDPTLARLTPGLAPTRGVAPGTPGPLTAIGPHLDTGEGTWVAGPTTRNGVAVMYETFVRPDPAHPGVVAAVARFDQDLVTARLVAGTKEPDKHSWPDGGQVPMNQRADLVATFNSGFKMIDAQGGYYARNRMVQPLRNGAASLVIDRDGRVAVDMWGRDARLGPNIAAVRQNLSLIIDNNAPVPGLGANKDGRWGSSDNQLQYTWRSAVGVDSTGNLYYVAGNQLTLATLTRALADTGVVRGMELDIHPEMVNLFFYHHAPGAPAPTPTRLLPTMHGSTDRYLRPDQRDFIALTLRNSP